MKSLGMLILLLSTCAQPPTPGQPPTPENPIAQTLSAVAGGAEIPADLSIVYSDMHGMWGGTSTGVSADGAYEWNHRDPRQGEPERVRGKITEEQLRGLVGLLVELQAWRQVTPPRQAVPDESRAVLMIRAGGGEAQVWEWFNEMPGNNRLSRILGRMGELRQGFPSSARPGPGW